MKYFLLIFLVLSVRVASAQDELVLGENILAELGFEQAILDYSFSAPSAAPLTLEAQSLSPNFAPLLLLYDDTGKLLQREKNPLASPRLRLTWTPQAQKTYRIRVMGLEGTEGNFILSLNPASTSLPPANELRTDMILEDRVTLATPIIRYQLKADRRQSLSLQVSSLLPRGGVGLVLTDLDGNLQGMMRHGLGGGAFIIPAAADMAYELWIIHSGADQLEGFNLTLTPLRLGLALEPETSPSAEAPPAATLQPSPNVQVIIPFDGPCAVTSLTATGVNIRRGPSTQYEIVSGLTTGEILTVTGRNQNAQWWQVEYETGLYGWVVDTGVRRGGDCTAVGFVPAPAPPAISENAPIIEETPISEETPTSEGN